MADGVTELSCHPGADVIDDLQSTYLAERGAERLVLCHPRLKEALAARGIELCSFASLDAGGR